jgi:hypothetical protein
MSIQRIVKAAALRAGLPKARSPHWLRHAHCSHALDRGGNPALVRDTAGHAELRVTSVYSHAQPTDSSARFLVGRCCTHFTARELLPGIAPELIGPIDLASWIARR